LQCRVAQKLPNRRHVRLGTVTALNAVTAELTLRSDLRTAK
jgi:hypothetical protein